MRRFVRHPTDIPIRLEVAALQVDLDRDCQMTTVSQGGLSCEVAKAFPVGSLVDIDIPSICPAYHGRGEVVWCQPRGRHFEVGIRFTDREEAFKSRMVQQVCQIEHYKNLIFEREGRVLDGNQAAREWIDKFAARFD